MVLVGDKKYACETCIKGHRSSSCKHADRPLYEIKKKGRPVTQCDHCRELRRTKQVHVKCVCETKDTGSNDQIAGPSSAKKGSKKVPESAAFPSGLPEGLSGVVMTPPKSDWSDSEHGSERAHTCDCKATGICNCAVPRIPTSAAKRKARMHTPDGATSSHINEPQMNQPAALVASANSGKNRPVLPRPAHAPHTRSSPPRSHPHSSYQQHRSHTLFSPYERAYEYAHGADISSGIADLDQAPDAAFSLSSSVESATTSFTDNFPSSTTSSDDLYSSMSSWLSSVQPPVEIPPLSCECGDSCACPGCFIHQGSSATRATAHNCANPSTCMFCFNCTLLAAMQDNNTTTSDNWFQGSSFPDIPGGSSSAPPSFFPTPSSSQDGQNPQQFDPSMWQTYALWANLSNQPGAPTPPEDAEGTCCNGQCKCPPGMCACPSDCCGCCSGCSCPSCEHEDRSMGSGKTLTFAVSGERGPCCSGGGRRRSNADPGSENPGPSTASASRHASSSTSATQNANPYADRDASARGPQGMYDEWSSLSSALSVPRVSLSRASSSSSRSSSQHSHRSSSYEQGTSPGSLPRDSAAIRSCCRGLQAMGTSSSPGSHASASGSVSPIPPPYTPSSVGRSSASPKYITEDANARIF